jgi:hypothetical protein
MSIRILASGPRKTNILKKTIVVCCLLSQFAQAAFAQDPFCELYMLGRPSVAVEDAQVLSYDANPFYNGALLLELFGPTRNKLRDWLSWMEAEAPGPIPENLPGLYLDGNRFVVGKFMEFPIDAGIMQFRNGDASQRLLTKLMEFMWDDSMLIHGNSETARAARQRLLEALDQHLFGIYGALRSDTYENLNVRAIAYDHALLASLHPRIRYNASLNPFSRASNQSLPATRAIDDLKQVAEVVSMNDESVIVKIDLGRNPLNRNQEVIQKMFFITHWQMVQKVYRESRLFSDNMQSAIYLLDDFTNSLKSSGQGANIYLMYDIRAWESKMFRMNIANHYVAIFMDRFGLQPYRYQTIADVFYPFYPIYGMITQTHLNGEVELKRLFHNNNPDPLNRLHSQLPPSRTRNMLFYRAATAQIHSGTTLVAYSTSPVNTRLYQSFGFQLVESGFFPEWGTHRDVLKMIHQK